MKKELMILMIIGTFLFSIIQFSAITNQYVINDDVRVHYYPILKLSKGLFENDKSTDLLLHSTPKLFQVCILLLSKAINLIVLSKIISFTLFIIMIYFSYSYTSQFSKRIGFLFTLIFMFIAWCIPSISGGLPRSFSFILIFAFLYYQKKKKQIMKIFIFILSVLIYPPALFINWLVYLFIVLQRTYKKRRFDRELKIFLIVTIICLSLGYISYSNISETEFGRLAEFKDVSTSIDFDKERGRIPIYPYENYFYQTYKIFPYFFIISLMFVPFYFKKNFSKELNFLVIAGIIMHFTAFFAGTKLHFYTRYSGYTLPIFLCFAVVIGLNEIVNKIKWKKSIYYILITLIFISILPSLKSDLINCDQKEIYDILGEYDANILIAGNPKYTSCIPLYSERNVMFSDEVMFAEYVNYYQELKKEILNFFEIYYSNSTAEFKRYCSKNDIDILVINKNDFDNQTDSSNIFYYEPYQSYISEIRSYSVPDFKKESIIFEDYNYILADCSLI